MHAFDVLGDPVRRRILEMLADSERSSGEVVAVVQAEFGITQSAVSQHLKVLRESGFAGRRIEGPRRIYAVQTEPLQQVDAWLERFRGFWRPGSTRWRWKSRAASVAAVGKARARS